MDVKYTALGEEDDDYGDEIQDNSLQRGGDKE